MEHSPFLLHCTLFMFFVLNLCLSSFTFSTSAEDHIVGGDEGWAQSVNYLLWSESQNFTVGDALVFSYVKGQHDVYEVNEDTYRSCDSTSGVIKKYDSGNDRIILEEAKKYYFICTTNGHCFGGMKLAVDVKEAPIPPVPPPRSAPSPVSGVGDGSRPDQSNEARGGNMHWGCTLVAAVVSVLLIDHRLRYSCLIDHQLHDFTCY